MIRLVGLESNAHLEPQAGQVATSPATLMVLEAFPLSTHTHTPSPPRDESPVAAENVSQVLQDAVALGFMPNSSRGEDVRCREAESAEEDLPPK